MNEIYLEQFNFVGEGWCRSDCNSPKGCKIHQFKKNETNPEECKKICLDEPGCTAYATTTRNVCKLYGFIHSAEITGTTSGWTQRYYGSDFIPSKTVTLVKKDNDGNASCHRRAKVADLIQGVIAF